MPNEPCINKATGERHRQHNGRSGFEALVGKKRIGQLEIFPYIEHLEASPDMRAFSERLCAFVEKFNPDIIFAQHVGGRGIPEEVWSSIKGRARTLVYHDADPFTLFTKRIDRSMRSIMKSSDLVLGCGLGAFRQAFMVHGAKRFGYVPHCFDRVRFGHGRPELVQKKYGALMIASRVKARNLPITFFPGARTRARFAKVMEERFGEAFAIYGTCWEGLKSWKGYLHFSEQENEIMASKFSVNWDHFDDVPYYFSDRLPISLAAGVPHLTSWHPGYDEIFKSCRGLYWAKTPEDLADCAEWMLSRSNDVLLEEGLAGREWVAQNLSAERVYEQAFNLSLEVHNGLR